MRELRGAQGCEVVVCLLHGGMENLEDQALARAVAGTALGHPEEPSTSHYSPHRPLSSALLSFDPICRCRM